MMCRFLSIAFVTALAGAAPAVFAQDSEPFDFEPLDAALKLESGVFEAESETG